MLKHLINNLVFEIECLYESQCFVPHFWFSILGQWAGFVSWELGNLINSYIFCYVCCLLLYYAVLIWWKQIYPVFSPCTVSNIENMTQPMSSTINGTSSPALEIRFPLKHQRYGLSENGGLSCRSSSGSVDSMTDSSSSGRISQWR